MKKSIFIIFALLTILFVNKVIAGVSITQFSIPASSLNPQGRLTIASGLPTTFNLNFTFIKSGDLYNTVRAVVIYRESGQADLEISTAVWKYDGEWSNSNLMWVNTVACTLPANKTVGNIYLKYEVWQGSNTGGSFNSDTNYGIGVASTGPPTSSFEGFLFVNTGTDPIYLVLDGKRRHIQTMDTFLGIFVRNANTVLYNPTSNIPLGLPIGPDTSIIWDSINGKCYFREGNIIRHITSPEVASRYQFQLKNIQNINGTSGYLIGSPML
ncbi:hypothetical protein EZ456_08220 [Pedobacter psychrodurus]|uniref:Uncharacterized protein n=1 Tax=Pedobacter psychrodurus TaxID=2530456 RepID=A0A4R0PY89_9SPHI|nr:hypothetical protein [Pedobacter psychrodurus]TCD27923.1 hypothetical protein EZ456_08220 [Pedobacter psychrodurus]